VGIPFLDALKDPRQDVQNFIAEQAQKYGLPPELISGAFNGPRNIPTTRARMTHGYTLQTSKGQVIGAVFRTEYSITRRIDREFEIDPNAVGEPADLVPQELTEQTFQIARWDLFEEVFEEIFQDGELDMLTDQTRGFKIREVWRAPSGILNSRGRQYEYFPCWFERLGRTQESTGDRTVRVNASLHWMRRRKVA
jgi:hypothetical protein